MRIPLEYGDNFPVVPPGSWNPSIPWRFPKMGPKRTPLGMLAILLPWATLGLGVSLGILWMSWRSEPTPPVTQDAGLHSGVSRPPLLSPGVPAGAPRGTKPMRGAKRLV